jgi:hypothetical protein
MKACFALLPDPGPQVALELYDHINSQECLIAGIKGAVTLGAAKREALEAQNAVLREALEACLERLELVDTDSESIFFVESCEPVIAQARAALNICDPRWVDARNEIVQDGELRLKCYAPRPGNFPTPGEGTHGEGSDISSLPADQ